MMTFDPNSMGYTF